MPRRVFVPVVSLLAWTLFVWVGRVRNALGDPELRGSERVGPLLLATSFIVPAEVLAVVLFASARRPRGVGPVLRYGVLALAAWTCGVWVVRMADIAFGGDWEVGFVVVHAVLAAVSIVLAVLAARSVTAVRGRVDAGYAAAEGVGSSAGVDVR